MKKFLSMLLTILMIAGCMSVSKVFAADINVTIDKKAQTYDVMPVIENGRTLVPMRAIFEALGAEIDWDDSTRTVTGTKGDVSVVLTIGNAAAKVNDKEVTLDVPAMIVSDRTMVPVRFISESLGCNVGWDDATKTVIISTSQASANKGMAELVSTMHRRIPTEFKKSNDLNDILHFEEMSLQEQEKLYQEVKSQGEVVCTEDQFLDGIFTESEYGTSETVEVKNQPFKKAVRITCNKVPEKSSDMITRTPATPEKNKGDGVKKEDIMLLAFKMRTINTDSEDGMGRVQVQIEHPTNFKKALFEFAIAGKDWTIKYLPFSGIDDATSIGIRGGFALQTVELGGVEIINLGPDFDVKTLPQTYAVSYDLLPEAQWRKDANERIEKLRKGDFSVVVKDKDGNVIPGAEVEFDMFEHQFHFGNAINPKIHTNPTYAEKHEELFNAAVVEHYLKWGPYEDNPQEARWEIEAAKKAGCKYIRGHSLFWERMTGSNNVYLSPAYMESEEIKNGNRELYNEYCETHVRNICTDFYNDLVEWDVINEILYNRLFADVFGYDTWKDQFEWARKYSKPGTDLYYNDYAQFENRWFDILKEFINTGADFDGVGFQSHYDENLPKIEEIIERYNMLEQYGDKKLKVTEYSCSIPDIYVQANFTRDVLIASFAEDDMTGFIYWGFWDGSNFAPYSPFYDKNWNLKPAGEQFVDLVYNKWWTRDAKATTDAEGKATVRGFYGDYDITVKAGDKTKTEMVAFHKGYDNELVVVIE
ncbi:MAG: hypothetical protein E7396_09455 [Ruminococcaceae bacterium]|nr:hypothetical protein [Oscillospiraceae bacterium]